MKREIDVFEHTAEIMDALRKGILLTTKADGRVNTMAISWGMFGIEWSKPTFMAVIREHRFTREMLDKNPEFTLNLPVGTLDQKILGFCGSKSGRDVDKIDALHLTLEPSECISVPGIREFPLTLECKVVYQQLQDANALTPETLAAFYPQDVDSSASGPNRDLHIAYYGEIVKAYIIE